MTNVQRLELNLQAAHAELEQTRHLLQEKKAELNATKEDLFTLQTDVGKWRYIAESRGSAAGDQQAMEMKLAGVHKQYQQQILDLQQQLQEMRQQSHPVYLQREVSFLREQVQTLTEENENMKLQLRNALQSPPPMKLGMGEFCNNPRHNQLCERVTEHEQTIVSLHQQLRRASQGSLQSFGPISQSVGFQPAEVQKEMQQLRDQADMYKHQALVFKEDFERERQDRESINDRLLTAQDKLKHVQDELMTAQEMLRMMGNQ